MPYPLAAGKQLRSETESMTKHTELPHSDEAEVAVLSSVLLDGAPALTQAFEGKITEAVFYNPVHQRVWKSICWLHKQGHPIELSVLAEELKKAGKLEEIGGVSVLAAATSAPQLSSRFDYWIQRVRELYVLRELNACASRIQEKTLAYSGSVEDFVAETHKILSIQHATQTVKTLPDAANTALEQCVKIRAGELEERDLGLSFPWRDWDDKFGTAKPGDLIVIGARPGIGKSSVARQIAWHWAKTGNVLLFSREMPVDGLPVLFAQGLCGHSWRDYRRRKLHERDMDEFDDALGAISRCPTLKVFDRDRTISQLTARVKACQQTMEIKGILVDYLQRYDPQQERGETRDVALGRFSMALKDMAVDIGVPVILLVQVSRGVEKEDREPRLSDIRECLSVRDTLIFSPQGVYNNVETPLTSVSMNETGGLEATDSRNAPREASENMLRISLRSGREIVCTPNHPIKTDIGWVLAKDIKDHAIACARSIPAPRNTVSYPKIARWMGWMLGNGSGVGNQSPSFICSCDEVALEFLGHTHELFGFLPKPHAHKCQKVFQYDLTASTVRTKEGNPVTKWMRQHGMWGARSYEKTIPTWFCETADNESLAQLVAGMWDTDGCVMTEKPCLSWATTSKHMAWQMIWALTRLGIFASIEPGYMGKKAKHMCYKVRISDREEIVAFRDTIPLSGRKGRALRMIDGQTHSDKGGSRLSIELGRQIDTQRRISGLSHAQLGYRFQNKRMSQADLFCVLKRLAEAGFTSPQLNKLVDPTVYWDCVRHIKEEPGCSVFDRVVPELHNFVANGIVVHNSGNIEQDADRVIFIHAPTHLPDGSMQDLNDGELRRIHVQFIQAKGRGEGRDRLDMKFNRPITRFEPIAKTAGELV